MREYTWFDDGKSKSFEDWIKDPDFRKEYNKMQEEFARLELEELMLKNHTVIRDLTEPTEL